MDVFKNIEEFHKKDFNKTAIAHNRIFPYNFIDHNLVSDSSLNKYYKYYIKKQASIIHDKRAFDIIEQLNNEKALEQLRTQRENEKETIYKNIFDKKTEEIEEFCNINVNNYKEKLDDKKNNEDQGFNIMYLLMKLLKCRQKKIVKKKKIPKIKSINEEKKDFYLNKYKELLNEEDKTNKKNNIIYKDYMDNNIKHCLKNNNINSLHNPKVKKDSFLNDYCSLSEKKAYNKLTTNNYFNKRKSYEEEKSNKLKVIKYSLLNSSNRNDKQNLKTKLNENMKIKLFKKFQNYSLNLPKSHRNHINFDNNENSKIKKININKLLLKEKIKNFEKNYITNSLNSKTFSMNKTSFGKFDLEINKKRNQKKLLGFNIKEKEITNLPQNLSKQINTNDEKNLKNEKENKKLNNMEKVTFKESIGNIIDNNKKINILKIINKKKKKIKDKIEYNINNIIYENKSKYKLSVINKYIFGKTINELDIIDNLKENIVYELKRQLLRKHSKDLLKINKNNLIKTLNNKFQSKKNFRSSSK